MIEPTRVARTEFVGPRGLAMSWALIAATGAGAQVRRRICDGDRPYSERASACIARRAASMVVCALATVLLLAAAQVTRAEDGVVVTANVDARQIPLGETLSYTIEVRGAGMSGVTPTPPTGLVNLQIAGGPSTSTSFSFVNGAVSSSRSLTWYLAPQAVGKARIPALELKVGGKIYRTEPIEVEVMPAGSVSKAPAPGLPPARGAPGGAGREPSQADLRLESEVSAQRVYVGQPLVLTTRLITRVQVVDVSAGSDPTLHGFLLEEADTDVVPERVFREGREYRSYVLMRRILTPTTPGTTVIPPETRTIRIRSTNRDAFDFFSPRVLEVTRVSSPVTIEALSPPVGGRPADFSGAVGVFKLDFTADRKDAAVGDAVGVKVTLSGTGNLKTVESPVLSPTADFRIFDPRVEEKISGFKPRTYTKTWSYVLTPLSPGEIPLPTVSFSYFDPEAKAYRRLASPDARLRVQRLEPGAAPEGQAPARASRREVQTLQKDIRFLKSLEGPLARKKPGLRSYGWVWAAIAVSLLAQPLAWYLKRRGGPSSVLPGGWRGRARRRALKEIAQVQGRDGNAARISSVAAGAILRFIADRCRVPASGLTYEEIGEQLERRGVSEGPRAELRALLELCDRWRFAPEGEGQGASDELLAHARTVIERLDREIETAA